MTVVAPPPPQRKHDPVQADPFEALIEEARRRARRRRQAYGLAALLAALSAGAFFGWGGRGGGGDSGPVDRQPLPAAARSGAAVTNGTLTILGGRGIANLGAGGRLQTVIRCEPSYLARRDSVCGAHAFSVDWAPDGRRIAYATAIGPGASADAWRFVALHVHDTVTGRHRRLPLHCFAGEIDWSPDGEWLAYACGGLIYLATSDLVDRRVLTAPSTGVDSSPSWSADGRRIVFSRRQAPGLKPSPFGDESYEDDLLRPGVGMDAIYVTSTNPDTRRTRLLVRDAKDPAWSPDGSTIAYRDRCGVKLITPAGRDVTPVSKVFHCRAIGISGTPVWSPDGRRIAIAKGWPPSACRSDELWKQAWRYDAMFRANCRVRPGIYVIDADGSDLRLVTREVGRNFAGRGRPTWRPRPKH